jgi:hypothetical protein
MRQACRAPYLFANPAVTLQLLIVARIENDCRIAPVWQAVLADAERGAFGYGNSWMDVTSEMQGVLVSKRYGRRVDSIIHLCYLADSSGTALYDCASRRGDLSVCLSQGCQSADGLQHASGETIAAHSTRGEPGSGDCDCASQLRPI